MLSPQHTGILKAVSRSFYLSLRFLPGPVRGPLSLGYLLARASDTIADTAVRSVSERLALLDDFARLVPQGGGEEFFRQAAAFAAHVDHRGERALLERLGECFALMAAASPEEQRLLHTVLERILRGQRLDLERFASPAALPDAAALQDYTFHVAGCVGEFWTGICALKLPQFSRLPVEEMEALGIRYGHALQLINILRDQPKDMAAGRCYLPGEELRAAGLTSLTWPSGNWPAWHAVRRRWLETAQEHLEAARTYIRSLRSLRLRFATLLPLLIGRETLALLASQPEDRAPEAAKVPRSRVKRLLLRAAWLALRGRA